MPRDSGKLIQKFSIENFVRCGDGAFDASAATAWALCLSSFCADKEVSFEYHARQLHLDLEGKTVRVVFKEIVDFGGLAPKDDGIDDDHNLFEPGKKLAFSSAVYFAAGRIQRDESADTGAADLVVIFDSRSDGGVDVQVILSRNIAPEVIMWASHRLKTAMERIGYCSDDETLLSVHIVSAAEENALERLGQNNENEYHPQNYLVHQLFEKQALTAPHNSAIQFEDEEPMVYEALNGIANRLARHILQVLPDDNGKDNGIIALCLEKGVSMIIAILAVLKAGKAWVPLDPKNPRNRLDKILQATQAPLTIVTRSTVHILGDSPVLVLDEIDEELQWLSPANINLPTKQNDLCHVLFTSGSTGVPKGVMIEHGAMVNTVCWLANYCDLNECTRTLQFAAYTFDVCGLDIFMTLSRGGCLFVAPTTKLLADLNGFVESRKINYAQLTPTVINLLFPSAVPSLKTLVSSGEAMTENIITTWLGRARLINAYGPTETNVCTLYDVSSNPVPNCIGGPDWGMRVLILNEHGRKVPIGAIGEICVVGPQLFRGYLCDSEMTLKKKKVLTHAIGLGPLYYYKTGDLGRFDGDGRIYYHGRQDSQVKLLGNRVDLAEIETCITACGSTRHNVVIVPRVGPASGRLSVVLSLTRFPATFLGEEIRCLDPEFATSGAAHEDLSAIKDRLLSELPSHMIPSVWLTLQNVPLTTSGKVNRRAARDWLETLNEEEYRKQVQTVDLLLLGTGNAADDQSLTPAEEQMRDIWSQLLSLPPQLISVESSFFDLGGDSISVIRMVSEARRAGLMISVQDVFTLKTNRSLSRLVSEEQKPANGHAIEELPLTPFCILPRGTSPEVIKGLVAVQCIVDSQAVIDVYPCSPLQEGLMASSAKSGSYISSMVFQLPEINPSRFKTAWEVTVSNEEILRTRIVEIAPYGSLQAIVDAPVEWESSISVKRYLESTKSGGPMYYGSKLCRFALIFDNGRWHFILTIHHALFDGWSLSMIKKKLRIAYELGVTPPQSRPFKNFIQHLADHEPAGVKEFWISELDNASVTDYPELPAPQYEVKATMSSKMSMSIDFQHVLKSQKVTISAVVRAAWAIVLARHSNSDDVSFGVTLSGRNVPLEGIEEMTGPTMVTVPVRISVRDTYLLGELLRGIHQQAINMIPFEHTGLQNIQRISVSAKNACSFRTLLVIQPEEDSLENEFLHDLNHLGSMQRTYPLTIECQLEKGTITVHAHFDDTIINQRDVNWLLVHLREALHTLTSGDGMKTVREVSISGEEDVQQIREWTKQCPKKVDRCLHHLFEQKAAEIPFEIAIYDKASVGLSYAELDSMSTHLARKLQELQVMPETLVPICFEKSSMAIVAIMAVLKAGGAYVPLDISYPESRLEFIIKEVGAEFILCSPSCAQRFHGVATEVVTVDASSIGNYAASPELQLARQVQPHNAAFVTYTSGSTGVPKAVVLTHSAISTSATHLGKFYGIQENMRVLQFTSFTFDMSLKEIFITLLHGGCICMPSEYDRLNNLSKAAGDMAVDAAFLTPTVAGLMRPQECPSLKILCVGGEALSRDVANVWADRAKVINSYGPTETCMNVSATSSPLMSTSDLANIGIGVTGLVWIVTLDEPERLAPVGCPGEIAISGYTLARGYRNDPEKTLASFIETPAWTADYGISSRCYLTGDAGRYNSDGSIQYLGRLDRQVKLNGLRIELGEIEHQLRVQNNQISQAIAELVTIRQQNDPALVVFVKYESPQLAQDPVPFILDPTDQFRIIVTEARNRLRDILPPYMVPKFFIPVSRIPMTTSGKIDRKKFIQAAAKLTRRELEVSSHPAGGTIPELLRGENERIICDLWKKVLNVGDEPPLTVSDNFFHLGGDSIAAIRLVTAAREIGLSLSVSQIYQAPRLGEMANCSKCNTDTEIPQIAPFALARGIDPAEVASICKVPETYIEDVYPCTALQEGLMALSASVGAYVAQRVYTLSDFDEFRFRAAWEKSVNLNPILRTRIIHSTEYGSLQVVCKDRPSDLWHTGNNLERYLQNDRENLIIPGGRLCRFALIKEEGEGSNSYFVLTLHHALYDGWSMELLMDDLQFEYAHLEHPDRPGFNLVVEFLAKSDHKRLTEYWTRILEGATPSDFPPKTSTAFLTRTTCLEEFEAVVEHQSLLGSSITFATAVRAAWAFVLSRYVDSSDICFGVTLSGRDTDIPGVEDIIGPTAVTVPVRIQIEEKETIEHCLQRIQQQAVDMIPFQHAGLQNIQRLSSDARNACSFRNILVIQNTSTPRIPIGYSKLSMMPDKSMTNMLQSYFTVECQLRANGVSLVAHYDPSSIDQKQVQRLLRHFVNVIRQTITLSVGPHTLDYITMVTEEDFEEIQTWNAHWPKPVENCVHHLFEAVATIHPYSLAIDTTGNDKLTYSQLENYATRLANHITSIGVQRGDLIPICFHKSSAMVVAMLAIMKAGAAYVPINPSSTKKRLEYLLQETKANLVLVDRTGDKIFHELVKTVSIETSFLDRLPPLSALCTFLPAGHPSDMAYTIFTSGSTGKPKGVILEHGTLCTALLEHGKAFCLEKNTRVLQFCSYTFDVSVVEIFGTLLHGGCICMPSEEERLIELGKAIELMAVETAFLTPTVANLLQPEETPLKTLILMGEPHSRAHIDKWANKLRLLNGYGPTEATIFSCSGAITFESPTNNIGRALGGLVWVTEICNTKLAAIGTIGELVISGHNLARGYLNDIERTMSVFLKALPLMPHNDRTLSPKAMYKTGDLVRYNSDGTLQYLGRRDTQVKIHGQRIECGEVEYSIITLGGADQAVVELMEINGIATLVAFVCVNFGGSLGICTSSGRILPSESVGFLNQRLKNTLEDTLPLYMIPSIFVPYLSFPTTVSGKVDRGQLKTISNEDLSTYVNLEDGPKRQPGTPTECIMQGLWSSTLNISTDSVGLDDNFFRLGGDSISAIMLVTAARKLGFSLNINGVFRNPRLAEMSSLLVATKTEEVVRPFSLVHGIAKDECIDMAAIQCDIGREAVADVYPCSPLQEGLMALSMRSLGAYVTQRVYKLPQDIDITRLQEAWNVTVAANPILRTRIIPTETYGSMQVVTNVDVEWTRETLDLEIFLNLDRPAMGYGAQLCRQALVVDSHATFLVFTLHHCTYDGFSWELILDDLKEAYENGSITASRSPFTSFVNYIENVRVDPAAKNFWETNLAGAVTTSFPTNFASADCQEIFKATRTLHLETEVEFSLSSGSVTAATLLRAAWAFLISRYTNSDDIIFGETLSGRTAPIDGIATMTGPTIITVPTRVRINDNMTIHEYLNNIHAASVEMMPFEHLGLQSIRRISNDAQEACNFQNLLVIQPPKKTSTQRIGDKSLPLELDSKYSSMTETYCLSMECQQTCRGVFLSAMYDDDAIDSESVRWILYHFSQSIKQLAAGYQGIPMRIGEIDFFGEKDIHQIKTFNDTRQNRIDRCLHHAFNDRVLLHPNRVAIHASDAIQTYGELDALSSSLASKLMAAGVGPDVLVPLYFKKSSMMVVAMIAVLKAGGGYVPLDTSHPKQRLQYIIKEIGSKVLLCSQGCEAVCHSLGVPLVLSVDPMSLNSCQVSSSISNATVRPSNIAYVLFTSGSTGQPKGVVLDHSAVTTSIMAHGPWYGFEDHLRVLQFAEYTFDLSVTEIFSTLLFGGCVCIPSEEERLVSLPQIINEMQVKLALLTPTTVTSLLSPELVPGLSTLILGGEPITRRTIVTWSEKVRLFNGFGPTETCLESVSSKITGPEFHPANIGTAVAAHLWIADPENSNRLTPIGCVGELLISGPTLARGYLNDVEKTNAAFINGEKLAWARDALGSWTRIYKTGDLARYNADGSISSFGRKDTQVKLRGLRIEVSEIEHHLSLCPGINNAAVESTTSPAQSTEARLIAFVCFDEVLSQHGECILTLNEQINATLSKAATRLSDVLPSYMIPSIFLPLQRMPLTASGKTDRKELRKIFSQLSAEDLSKYQSGETYKRPPTSIMEIRMQALWAAVLQLAPASIGLDDNFFRLGGDSMSAIRLATTGRSWGIDFTVAFVFQHPRLSEMVNALEKNGNFEVQSSVAIPEPEALNDATRDLAASICGINPADVEDVYPCSPLQEGLMALSVGIPGAYMAQRVYELTPGVDLKRFCSAWKTTVHNHSILRTRIIQTCENGLESLQVVCRESLELEWCVRTSLQEYMELDYRRPVEYGRPLIRCSLISNDNVERKENTSVYFVLTLHHALYDGVSFRLILDDFQSAYANSKAPYKTRIPFKNYIRYLGTLDQEASQNFWKTKLAGSAVSEFPSLPSLGFTPRAVSSRQFSLDFLKVAAQSQVTFPTIIRAAWAITISRHTQLPISEAHDICFGATLSGRTAPVPGLDTMAGPTIVTIPVRVIVNYDQPIADFLDAVSSQAAEMMPFEQFGLQNIRRLSADAERACGFKNLLVIHPTALNISSSMMDICMTPLEKYTEMLQTYGIIMECQITENGVSLNAQFDPLTIDDQRILWVLQHFANTIKELAQNSSSKRPVRYTLGEMATKSEYDQILAWNANYQATENQCLHQLVENTVSMHPHRFAVCGFDNQLTYEQLNHQSNVLAQHLIKLGVGPEVLVPICFEKSSIMIVAMLGILKAGGGYVPLDPAHPITRLEYIIGQTGARLIVSSPSQSHIFNHLKDVKRFVIDRNFLEQQTSEASSVAIDLQPKPTNVAYVIYTSGSSGDPKGVVVEHGAISLSVMQHGIKFGHNTVDGVRVLQFCSYTFDVSVIDIFTTLAYGGCICVPSEHDRLYNLPRIINDMKIDLVILTPTVAKLLEPADVPNLKVLAMTGEVLSSELIKAWTHGSRRVVNGYGPTEASVDCAAALVTRDTLQNNIGHNLGGLVWITEVDDHNQLTPLGCVGEIVISGDILARGYLKDSKRTAAAFINNPTWMPHGHGPLRIYKTGDLARYAADGSVEYLGRKDAQVKLHGMRIETGEIESRLGECETVLQSAVQLVTRNGVDMLVGFLRLETSTGDSQLSSVDYFLSLTKNVGAVLDNAERIVKKVLPSYMVPNVLIPLSAMPCTTSGKTDRRKLNELFKKLPEKTLSVYRGRCTDATKREPVTTTQKVVRDLWADILRVDTGTIGLDDNFFRMGGDSISAIQLVSAFRKKGLTLAVTEIHQSNDLADMAAFLDTNNCSSPQDVEIPVFSLVKAESPAEIAALVRNVSSQCRIEPELVQDIYPCSPLQEGLVALSIRETGTYLCQKVYRLSSVTDLNRFRTAWENVLACNEILRTRIVHVATQGSLQVVLKPHEEWKTGSNMLQYLETERGQSLGYGDPLCRYGIFTESTGELYFVLSIHHALYDGWSLPLIIQDLKLSYENRTPLPSHTPYNHFVGFIAKAGVESESAKLFWRDRLAGAVATDFPEKLPSHKINANAVDRIRINLDRRNLPDKVTVASLIKAAWALVLSRYTHSNDVCFGMALTGRNSPVAGIESITGPTQTAVPIRITIDPTGSITTFLRNVHSQSVDMIPYEHVGLQHIQGFMESVKCCEFRNFLIIQPSKKSSPDAALQDDGKDYLQLEQIDGFLLKQQYALAMECELNDDGSIDLAAYFDSFIIDKIRIEWLLQHFAIVIQQLESLSTNDESTIAGIVMTTKYDQEMIWSWNKDCPAAANTCVHEIFQEKARQNPRLQAIKAFDRNLDYGELDRLSSDVAYDIIGMNVRPGAIIPICIEKSSTMVIALMAVLKAGAAYVPLDPSYPPSRLEYILREVKADMVLVSDITANRFDGIADVTIVSADKFLSQQSRSNGRSIPPALPCVNPSDVAYIMFTSGSTGKPKGVVMEHSALSTTVLSEGQDYGLYPGLKALQFSNITFDASTAQIFTTLVHGGCICIPSEHDSMNRLAETMNELQIEIAHLTPTVLSLIDLKKIPSLRTLILGGECMTEENIKDTINTGIRLINSYGPTETCIDVIINNAVTLNTSPNNIGLARSGGAWILELDNDDRLAPLGCVGELAISGPTLARGYLNDEEKTNASFIENLSWMRHERSRIYKTGDLARFNGDGSIQFLGRRDTQVKVHGHRIELGEIENKICHLWSDVQAAVEFLPQGKRLILIAFVVGRTSSTCPNEPLITRPSEEFTQLAREIIAHLKDLLPAYMVPSLFIPISHLPMALSAKLDRPRLREAFSYLSEDEIREYRFRSDGEILLPTTKTEKLMQALWAKVLGISDPSTIGLDDSFFELGGDSITAIQLVAAVRREAFSLTVSEVFATSKLRQMSAAILRNEHCAGAKSIDSGVPPPPFSLLSGVQNHDSQLHKISAGIPVEKSSIQDVYPATAIQLACLIKGQNWHKAYYAWFTLDIEGDLDLGRLRQACQSVVDHHPILRTVFYMDGRCGLQVVLRKKTIDFQALQDKCDLDSILQMCQDFGPEGPVSFGKPMTKFRVLSLDQKRHCLAVGLSHAQYDGMCLNLILGDIRTAYVHQPLPIRPQYSIFISYALRANKEDAKLFWKTALHDSTMTNLVSRSLPSDRHLLQSREERQISPPQSRPHGATFSTILKAAWSLVLAQFCGKFDIVFGNLISGRNAPIEGVEEMVGPCMNVVPIRVHLDQHWKYNDLLDYLREQQSAMIPYETMPFADIVEKCTQWPKSTRFGSVVQHQNLPAKNDGEFGELAWKTAGSIAYPGLCDEVDSWVCSVPHGDSITIGLRYNDWILPSSIAGKLLDCLCTKIMDIFENPDRNITSAIGTATTATSRPLLPVHASTPSACIAACKETAINYQVLLTLRDAWQESLLGDVPAGEMKSVTHDVDANFFEIGGDSIAAAQLAASCASQHLHITIQDVFDYPTLRLQALLASGNLKRKQCSIG
ncbi:NRPS [Rhizina undulata]